jgi:hypothetical protein
VLSSVTNGRVVEPMLENIFEDAADVSRGEDTKGGGDSNSGSSKETVRVATFSVLNGYSG